MIKWTPLRKRVAHTFDMRLRGDCSEEQIQFYQAWKDRLECKSERQDFLEFLQIFIDRVKKSSKKIIQSN